MDLPPEIPGYLLLSEEDIFVKGDLYVHESLWDQSSFHLKNDLTDLSSDFYGRYLSELPEIVRKSHGFYRPLSKCASRRLPLNPCTSQPLPLP